MIKFNKALKSKIISITVGAIFLLNNLLYASPAQQELRIPMNSRNRLKQMQEESLSSNKEISRRDFIKQVTVIGAMSTILPILISGDTPRIIDAIANLDKYPLSTKYLYSLTKREGTAYIQGIYHAAQQGKITKTKADLFLRDLFNNEELLWMREEAIKVLIKLDMVSYEELEELIETAPDESVKISIVRGLGEKSTPEADDKLIKWHNKYLDLEKAIIDALVEIGSNKVADYFIEMIKTRLNNTNVFNYILSDYGSRIYIGSGRQLTFVLPALGRIAFKSTVEKNTELSDKILRYLNKIFDKVSTKQNIDYTIMNFMILSLGEAGDYNAVERIIKFSNSHSYQKYYGPPGYSLAKLTTALSTAAFKALQLGDKITHDLALERLKEFIPKKRQELTSVAMKSVLDDIARIGSKEAIEYITDLLKFEFALENYKSYSLISTSHFITS